jgi:glycerol-3-phosphate cytidylyltransferase
MKTVITYGTFDLLHVGHIRLLSRLKRLGDRLVVGLSTDAFNAAKGKQSIFSYEERLEIMQSLSMVDIVIPEHNWEQKVQDIKQYQAAIFAIGDDWAGKFDYLSEWVEVVYTPRTAHVSTTNIKQIISKIKEENY